MKIPWPPSLNYKKVVFILAFMVLFLSHTCHPVELNQIQSNQAEKMSISFDESLKSPEQCPKMIPKYLGNVQPRGKYIAEKMWLVLKNNLIMYRFINNGWENWCKKT